MFWKSEEREWLDKEIIHELRRLHENRESTEDYDATLERLSTLYKMKEEEKSKSGISKDTAMVVLGNLLGILIIVKAENVNVITSRAIQILLKPITRT